MRVAVTGAGGLVGGNVVRALLDRGHQVRAVARRRTTATPPGAEPVTADVTRPGSLREAFGGVDAVVHCAAPYSYELDSGELERIAVDGTGNVLRAAAAAGATRVVVTSSSVTCGSAAGPAPCDETTRPAGEYEPAYFFAKRAQEDIALDVGTALGLEVVVACPTVVLGGPDARLVPSNAIIARYLRDPTRTTFPGGCNVVSASDVGLGHAVLLERGSPGERYLLGGSDLTWAALHRLVSELAGVAGPFAQAPAATIAAVAAAAQWWARLTGAVALVTEQEAATIGRYYWYRHDRAAALGYAPGTARAAVAQSLSWLLASEHLPRWVRESLRPVPEVYEARALVPRSLPAPSQRRYSTRISSSRTASSPPRRWTSPE